ncbi:alpha/beta fold hydrolase [Streptomyces xanthii]|uniref:Alpha/beta hydrolase n=1 Tax=Streptomyces xanthii TaxID=2768069 RepID=A0A7H1BB85_9ACTN|nr:alpha/beta fold hydrolase [Streptomyces xanthii]QNS05990.1 alpha/beta hydrolase [Streptomyces xanthii]
MANFVLVAGARLGAWAWDDVVPWLEAAGGHGVYSLTLSGLAERAGGAAPVGRQGHVRDVVDFVERAGLRDVVLVGHSYAGVPVGQAAGLLGERLRRVVFVDSSVPVDGEPFVAVWPDGGAGVRASLAENGGWWPCAPAAHFEGHGLSPEQIARIVAGSTPHPGTTLTEPAVLARPLDQLPATYVLCELGGDELDDPVAELVKGERWRLAKLDAGHWPMFSRPRELADVLLEAAAVSPAGRE